MRSAAVLLCLQRSRRMCESWECEAETMTDSRVGPSSSVCSSSSSLLFLRTCWFGRRWAGSCFCRGFGFWLDGGGDSWTTRGQSMSVT